MKSVLLLLLGLFVFLPGRSQFTRRPVASPAIGLGAYSRTHADVFSYTNNTASLAQLKKTTAGVYGERRFLLTELNYFAASIAVPVASSGNFGLNAGYYGFTDYNETQVGLAYARSLGTKADIGVQFDYNGIRIAGYGNAAAVNLRAGALLHISEKLHAGMHIYNPVGGKFGKDQLEKLASVYAAGLGYEASEKFFVSTEIVKVEDKPVNVVAGIQYKFIPQLLARAGIATETSASYLALGLQLKNFRVDFTASHHPQLGFSPGLLLLFSSNTAAKN